VQSLAADLRDAGAKVTAQRLAGGLSEGLVTAGQRTANAGGGGRHSLLPGPRPALRRQRLGSSHGKTTRTRIDASRTASTEKGRD
jgi:hypothetical protein